MLTPGYNFDELKLRILRAFKEAEYIDVGEWQSQDISNMPEMVTKELRHINYALSIPRTVDHLQRIMEPNLPWAEDHFQERISGQPLNPPPSEAWWPFAQEGNSAHKKGQTFSHTYPERIWPKFANIEGVTDKGRQIFVPHIGIRFEYGDLDDVISLLSRNLLSRQAYLPIWFPEDTGAVHGGRVPCSIGYHFLVRGGRLDTTYFLRSCDFLRHWVDDMYMAARLMQHVVGKLQEAGHQVEVGDLIVQIASLHVFRGDDYTMRQLLDKAEDETIVYGAF